MGDLTAKEEAFAKAYVLNGGNATEAWNTAYPNSKATPASKNQQASRCLANLKVASRIEELKRKASAAAEKAFTITVEQRLKWLDEVAKAGLETYIDAAGNKRRENLSATRAAVQTMNEMLGVTPPDEAGKRRSFSVNLRIEDASANIEGEGNE